MCRLYESGGFPQGSAGENDEGGKKQRTDDEGVDEHSECEGQTELDEQRDIAGHDAAERGGHDQPAGGDYRAGVDEGAASGFRDGGFAGPPGRRFLRETDGEENVVVLSDRNKNDEEEYLDLPFQRLVAQKMEDPIGEAQGGEVA